MRKYREKGPIPSTKALIDALIAEGIEGATVLDIGGGIGAVQHELLAAGAAHVTSVDASASYLEAAREEASRSGVEDRVTYRHGDFVELAESVSPADILLFRRLGTPKGSAGSPTSARLELVPLVTAVGADRALPSPFRAPFGAPLSGSTMPIADSEVPKRALRWARKADALPALRVTPK